MHNKMNQLVPLDEQSHWMTRDIIGISGSSLVRYASHIQLQQRSRRSVLWEKWDRVKRRTEKLSLQNGSCTFYSYKCPNFNKRNLSSSSIEKEREKKREKNNPLLN